MFLSLCLPLPKRIISFVISVNSTTYKLYKVYNIIFTDTDMDLMTNRKNCLRYIIYKMILKNRTVITYNLFSLYKKVLTYKTDTSTGTHMENK